MYASLPSTSSSDTLVITSSLYLNHKDFFISEEDSFLPPCFLRCKPDSDSDSASATLSGMPRQYLQWSGCEHVVRMRKRRLLRNVMTISDAESAVYNYARELVLTLQGLTLSRGRGSRVHVGC